MAEQWFYARDNQQHGPVAPEQMRQMVRSGEVRPDDLVWSAGMQNWQPARDVPELAAVAVADVPAPMVPTAATAEAGIAPQAAETAPAVGSGPAGLTQIGPHQYARLSQHRPLPAVAPAAPGVLGYSAPSTDGVALDAQGMDMLGQTKMWVRLISVLTYLCVGLYVAGGIGVAFVGPSPAASVAYLLAALLYLPPAVFLGRYATSIATLTAMRRSGDLTAALAAQKSFWKYMGILTVIALALIVVVIVFAVALGVMGSMQ